MTHLDDTGDINIYFPFFQRQISKMNILKENWAMYLLSLLLLEFVNIVTRESKPEASNYDYVTKLHFKHFKITL